MSRPLSGFATSTCNSCVEAVLHITLASKKQSILEKSLMLTGQGVSSLFETAVDYSEADLLSDQCLLVTF